jgi:hypothetical protein
VRLRRGASHLQSSHGTRRQRRDLEELWVERNEIKRNETDAGEREGLTTEEREEPICLRRAVIALRDDDVS